MTLYKDTIEKEVHINIIRGSLVCLTENILVQKLEKKIGGSHCMLTEVYCLKRNSLQKTISHLLGKGSSYITIDKFTN